MKVALSSDERLEDVAGEDLLTTTEVAELLGVTPATVRSYLARGQMPTPDRRYGCTALWMRSTVEHWDSQRPSRRIY